MMLFKSDGSDDSTSDSLAIPGYTQVTAVNQIKANRSYLITAQAPDGALYALYLNEDGAGKGPGASGHPECTANLTISSDSVSAVSAANTNTSIAMSNLHVTIAPSGGGYTIQNGIHSLKLWDTMFGSTSEATEFQLSFVTGDRFDIFNPQYSNRHLTFNVAGAPESHYPSTSTGFCGWADAQPNYIPIYLFIEGDLPSEPGMNLAKMLNGDQIGGGNTADENPGGQNSWVFTGGRTAQGSFDDVKGARTWAGHFEEYIRYTHAKQLQPSGETTTPYFQRHVINAAYGEQTLSDIVSSFDARIAPLKPRAVSYLVDEGATTDSSFSSNLNSLITKTLALQSNTGMIVIGSLTDADKAAVDAVVGSLTTSQQANVLSVQFSLSTDQKTNGYPNASGHFAMAQQLANAVTGSNVAGASNWPYGAVGGSELADDFPNKQTVAATHDYGTPSTLNDAQKAVQALAADKDTPATWLFMGDSITHGSAWTGGYDSLAQLFEKFVKDDLGRAEDLVINAGSSGATTQSTISDLNRRLVKYDPDVVVLMLGTNDAGSRVAADTYKANLRIILDKIMEKGATPVLRTPPPTSNANYDIAAYAGYIREVVSEERYNGKVILVDQYARWTSMNWSDVFTRDTNQSVHPDEAGHLWFVHQLIRELALWENDYQICQLEYVEMKEPEQIVIPGFTQLTNLNQLDERKGYLIVSRDLDGNLYALYPSEEGKTLKAGDLVQPGEDNEGARAASLTVSGSTVTATWLKDNSTHNIEKLLFIIEAEGDGYVFTAFNGRHLNMQDYMFTDGSVALTVTNRGTASLNAFEIKNSAGQGRVLDFNKHGDSNAFQGGTWGTDFWCPRSVNVPIYLFASNTATVPTAKEGIETLIQEDISKLNESDYTRATWAALQNALAAARAELDKFNESMTGDEENFVTARDNLQSAYDNLQRIPVIPTVPAGAVKREWRDMLPTPGTTKNEPFASGTGGSNKFRIPAIITLQHQKDTSKNGRLLAAIDARWNHTGDACGLDTIVSYSDDNGGNWNYNFANYFGDSVNAKATNATAFIDPVMVEGNDGTIYLMVDLWTGGVALNTAPMRPARATGYVEIDGTKRLVLYTSPVTSSQSDTNYSYYIGDFTEGYAPVYEPLENADAFSGYYVDEYYYLYHTDGEFASKTPASDKIYCQRLGEDSWVQQNVFFYNATLHARNVSYLWIVKSTDGGETWSAPQMINDQVRTGEDQFYGVGPGAGLCMENGTILLPVYVWPDEKAGFIYSTDNGVTWMRSSSYATEGAGTSSESCLVQIDENTVRHFYRDSWSNSMVVRYTDHTWNNDSWTTGTVTRVENAPRWGACQLSAIKYSKQVDGKDLILYSAPASTSGRAQGVIHALLVNEDKTMTLYNTYAVNGNNAYAYSSLTETENGNIALLYESTSDAVIFEIIPIDAILPSLTVTGYEGNYDGLAHSVTVSASEGVALQYSTDDGTTWSETNPTFTNAGTHTVKVKGTWGTVVKEATATVVIHQVTPALSITTDTGVIVKPGQTITFTVHGVPAEGQIALACDHTEHGHDSNISLTKQADGTWIGTHETALEEAMYTITATYTGNANYADATIDYEVHVIDLGVTIKAYTGVYDGQPHTIEVTKTSEDAVLTYCTEENGTYTADLPAYTDAGTYTTYYKVVKGEQTISGFAHVTISKAVPVITITCNKGTELSTDDLPLALTISGVPAEVQGKFTFSSSFNDIALELTHSADGAWIAASPLHPVTRTYIFTAVFDPTQTQAGAAISNPNYERATESITITVTRPSTGVDFNFSFSSLVAPDPDIPTKGVYTVPYDGAPHGILDALVYDSDAEITFYTATEENAGSEPVWSDVPPTFTQPGEYSVSCMATKGNTAHILTVVLKIVEGNIPTNLTITPSAPTFEGGGELTLSVSGVPALGSLTVTCNKTLTITETANRGVYTVELPNADESYTFTANYSGSGSYQPAYASCTVTVTEKSTSSGGSSSSDGSSSSPSTTTETKENADGSVTTIVTDHKTGTVTTTVTDPDGGQVEKISVPGKNVTITVTDSSGEPLAKIDLPATIPAPEQKFADVPENHWAEQGINDMAALGVIQGVGDNRFDMGSPIRRADLATMLFRLSNGKADTTVEFADVPSNMYYAEGVAWASKTGVVHGNGNGLFLPENTLTREEMAVMLYRFANLLKLDTTVPNGALSSFADSSQSQSWAADSLAWCVENGILYGRGNGILAPGSDVTRAEAAVMLQRFLTLMA